MIKWPIFGSGEWCHILTIIEHIPVSHSIHLARLQTEHMVICSFMHLSNQLRVSKPYGCLGQKLCLFVNRLPTFYHRGEQKRLPMHRMRTSWDGWVTTSKNRTGLRFCQPCTGIWDDTVAQTLPKPQSNHERHKGSFHTQTWKSSCRSVHMWDIYVTLRTHSHVGTGHSKSKCLGVLFGSRHALAVLTLKHTKKNFRHKPKPI